jgi:hypothetical protein
MMSARLIIVQHSLQRIQVSPQSYPCAMCATTDENWFTTKASSFWNAMTPVIAQWRKVRRLCNPPVKLFSRESTEFAKIFSLYRCVPSTTLGMGLSGLCGKDV